MKNLKDKGLLIFGIVVIAVIAGLLTYTRIQSRHAVSIQPNTDLLFYSSACSHCIKVEDFLKDNKADAKIAYQRLEVDFSQTNKQMLLAKYKTCGYQTDNSSIPIPFLYTKNGICFSGDEEIIKYFKTELGL